MKQKDKNIESYRETLMKMQDEKANLQSKLKSSEAQGKESEERLKDELNSVRGVLVSQQRTAAVSQKTIFGFWV